MNIKFLNKAVIVVICLILSGCTATKSSAPPETKSLKVMFWDESYFFQQYGDLFSMKYPNYDIQVVSTQSMYRGNNGEPVDYEKAFSDLVDKEQPDVLMLNTDQFETFISEDKLLELDTLIEKDKFDIEGIYPSLIEIIKEKGNGKIFGLSPSFSSQAIIYNTDLFDKYGIEPPHNRMTWQEIIDLAKRFPTDGESKDRVYGFGQNYSQMTLTNLTSLISSTAGLKSVNPATMKVTMNTDSWKQVYQLAQDAINSDTFYNPGEHGFSGGSMEEYYDSQLFLAGRIGMTIGGPNILQDLKQSREYRDSPPTFKIGIASGPVDPVDPGTTDGIYLSELFAISANSPNADAAWEFVKFLNGDDLARVKSKSMNGNLMARVAYYKEYNGYNLEPFFDLKPKLTSYKDMNKIPNGFYEKYYSLSNQENTLLEENKKSIDDVLKTLEEEGQLALDEALKKEADDKANGKTNDTSSNSSDGASAATESSSASTTEIKIETEDSE